MRAVDTNVLVRLIARDDAAQVRAAEEFVETGAWVSHLALVETAWVLDAVYDRSAGEIALNRGVTIEDYPDDTPFPSKLTLGWVDERPVHVMWAIAAGTNRVVIITVYEPNPEEWDNTFSQRQT